MPSADRAPGGTRALADDLAALAERLRRITVQVRAAQRDVGSGVVWRRDGLVLTNAHVARSDDAEVVLPDGRTLPARLTARDERRDLAALAVPAHDLVAAERADARAVRPGEIVVAMGHPLGVANALAVGVVHAAPTADRGASRWVRADIRLAPGNSGGPLADAGGRVIGLNAMIVGGLGYAVPTHAIERFLAGEAAQPRLGVALRPVVLRSARRTEQRVGLLVLEAADGGPAARAGVQAGDVLLAADGVPLDVEALAERLDLASPGDRWRLELFSGGAIATREVVLGAAGPAARAA